MELPVSFTPRKSAEQGLPRSPAQLSSEGLSSPPQSSPEVGSPSNQIVNEVLSTPLPSTSSSSVITSAPSNIIQDAQPGKPPPRKPRRKLKDSATAPQPKASKGNSLTAASLTAAGSTEAPKPKRIRKPKDPNAPPAQRRKKNTPVAKNSESLTDSKVNVTTKIQSPSSELKSDHKPEHILSSQIRNSEDAQGAIPSFFNHASPPTAQVQVQVQPVRKSGQKYDPIRSSNYDPVRETVVNRSSSNNLHGQHSKPKTSGNASTSPSISSLVDPQNQPISTTPLSVQSFFNQNHTKLVPIGGPSPSISPKLNGRDHSTVLKISEITKPSPPAVATKKSEPAASSQSKKSNTSITCPTVSPKPTKSKETKETKEAHDTISPVPPPLPGSGNESSNSNEYRAPTVILKIPINGEVNKYVNFIRLAEQQYGWDALHPRLAAQRDRLARVAAAGAALERNGSNKDSGDEMSLDSEAEGSNVEMGGMSDGRAGNDCVKKVPKKRKMREDEYDKDDGFVDDTELLWEEQAAATNDGFFVYSGPLVPEGEKAGFDPKSDGANKRGRGRGSRGGATRGAATRGGATNAASSSRSNLPASGPGSRGGTGARKPRVTKADRARMEQEKLEREKVGLTSTSSVQPNSTTPSNAPLEGGVPALLNH